jgi:hypothetical protein
MSSIQPIGLMPVRPTYPAQPASAPVVAATTASIPQPTANVASANYNWNYANPREHIFDHPYDGWRMNKGLMKLGGVGFWSRFAVTRAIASAITNIPTERLKAYAVREKFMQVPGMRPDYARVLQLAYAQQTGGQQPLANKAPLSWLGQFGAPGTVNDWIVRAPFQVTMQTIAVQSAMQTGHYPEVPGNRALESVGQQAMMIAPPNYNQYQQYPNQPMMPGQYPGGYGYGNDPINQIGNLIGTIGNIFK